VLVVPASVARPSWQLSDRILYSHCNYDRIDHRRGCCGGLVGFRVVGAFVEHFGLVQPDAEGARRRHITATCPQVLPALAAVSSARRASFPPASSARQHQQARRLGSLAAANLGAGWCASNACTAGPSPFVCRADLGRRAVAKPEGVVINERLLQGMQHSSTDLNPQKSRSFAHRPVCGYVPAPPPHYRERRKDHDKWWSQTRDAGHQTDAATSKRPGFQGDKAASAPFIQNRRNLPISLACGSGLRGATHAPTLCRPNRRCEAAYLRSTRPFLSMIKDGLRYEFSLQNFCRPGSPSRRRCCSAIGGDESDSAIFLSTSSPMASRRTDELVVKWVASNTQNLAAVFAWL